MLFNSHIFIFLFLPATLLVYFLCGIYSTRLSAVWLIAASLFFYGWWNPAYVGLLVGSILFNYSVGMVLAREHTRHRQSVKRIILIFGITGNFLILGYYKYANFFLSTLSGIVNVEWTIGNIVLPLGISFFTFTQIAYLVDAFKGDVKEYNLVHYSLFVTYFPHLIAGPILHHKEMMPQFGLKSTYRFSYENFSVGLTVFAIGLCKKVVLADSVAPYAQTVFKAASEGSILTFIEAWAGSIAYALQLYFDFSGYSDMAIGLAMLFGVSLPLNFYSPYQAVNIIEFWRRWHITLSRFLRDYLYIPLGGNRKGSLRLSINVIITMLLGGLWHGAGWTFIIWGGLHGLYIAINHIWHSVLHFFGYRKIHGKWWGRAVARMLTFLAVVVAWVFFRADSIDSAMRVLKGMAGLNGIILPQVWESYTGSFGKWLSVLGTSFGMTPAFNEALRGPLLLLILLTIVFFFPNTQQVMHKFRTAINIYRGDNMGVPTWFNWEPTWRWAAISAVLMTTSIVMIDKVSEFLYFQF
ncbi:MAG: MBOAT family protein [Ignavibacterium sp.]|nr:MBOAT family protein [Ignavibacterium sp.]